jgi:hypothetical protein
VENENLEQNEVAETKPSPLHTVNPLSKYLAMALFVAMPFFGGWVGYSYAPEKVVEVDKVVEKEKTVTVERDLTTESVAQYINTLNSEWPKLETDYMDISQPPPWAYRHNGNVTEATREASPRITSGLPSESCDFITKQNDRSWLFNNDSKFTWSGAEDNWVTGSQYGGLNYIGFSCEDDYISFYFTGDITMTGTTYYPICLGFCAWFNPTEKTEQLLSFIFNSPTNKPSMRSADIEEIMMTAHFEGDDSRLNYVANMDIVTDQLVYSIGITSDGGADGLNRWIEFPVDGYKVNAIETESF